MDSIKCLQGDTWGIAASLTDTHGSGLDLSSATVYWSLKEQRTGAASDFVVSGVSLTGYSSGIISGTIDTSVTDTIPPGRYYEELQVTTADAVARFQRYRVVQPVVGFIAETTPPPAG